MCTNRERCQCRQFFGPFECIRESSEAMHTTLSNQLLGRIHTDSQQHVPRDRPTEFVTRAFDGPLINGESELCRWHAESTRCRRDSQIACESELRSRTHRGSVDGRERDARQRSEPTQCRTECVSELVSLDPGQIGTRTECRRLPREHHHTGPFGNGALQVDHRAQRRKIDGIPAMRAANGDDRHVLTLPIERHGAFAFRLPAGNFLVIHLYHRHDCMTSGHPSPSSPVDPVRARRAQVAKYSLLANRIGYLLYAATSACFVLAFAIGFNATMVTLMTIGLVGGSVLLAPSIVLGYAVKAAEREDLEREREEKKATK